MLLSIAMLFPTVVCGDEATHNYYVSPAGSDSNAGTSPASAWRTIHKACASIPDGQVSVVNLAPGKYLESQTVKLPSGVTLRGAGVQKTSIMGARSPLFRVVDGRDIVISGIKFDGASLGDSMKSCTQMLECRGVENFQMTNVRLENFTSAARFHNAKKVRILNFSGWNSSVGTQETFAFITSAEQIEIGYGDLFNDDEHGGKAVGTSPDQTLNPKAPWELPLAVIRDFRVHDLKHFTAATGRWEVPGTGVFPPQICIELWHSELDNVEIDHCEFNNTVSCASGPKKGRPKPLRLHHNRWTRCRGYAIEAVCDGMEIDHNWVNGGYYPIAAFVDVPMDRLSIHHNVFEKQVGPTLVLHFTGGVRNLLFAYNTVIISENKALMYFGNGTAIGPSITVQNNLFYSTIGKTDSFRTDCQASHNLFHDVEPSGTNTVTANPRFAPRGSNDDVPYTLDKASPAIAAGKTVSQVRSDSAGEAPDLGAFAYGVRPWQAAVRKP